MLGPTRSTALAGGTGPDGRPLSPETPGAAAPRVPASLAAADSQRVVTLLAVEVCGENRRGSRPRRGAGQPLPLFFSAYSGHVRMLTFEALA